MEKQKLNLIKAGNLSLTDLEKFLNKNSELFDNILNEIIEHNIESELEYLAGLQGIEFERYCFGSVYGNDYNASITDIDKFLDNSFEQDNELFYELLEKLGNDKDNKSLMKETVDMLWLEVDERAIYDGIGIEDIISCESDFIDNYLNEYQIAVDLSTYEEYCAYELYELDIDYQDLN